MAFMNWKDVYNTGIERIDNQHRQLVELVNQLAEAMKAGKAREESARIITELAKYAVKHFSLEEGYFREYGYPDAEAHILKHREFEDRVYDFSEGFRVGRIALSLEIMTFLSDWLLKHINGADKAYSPFFLSKGAGS